MNGYLVDSRNGLVVECSVVAAEVSHAIRAAEDGVQITIVIHVSERDRERRIHERCLPDARAGQSPAFVQVQTAVIAQRRGDEIEIAVAIHVAEGDVLRGLLEERGDPRGTSGEKTLAMSGTGRQGDDRDRPKLET